jgi:hypothetical protein
MLTDKGVSFGRGPTLAIGNGRNRPGDGGEVA